MRELTTAIGTKDAGTPEIDLANLDAFILDMDGVVTNTARTHAAAWKKTFDDYLQARAKETGEAFVPFDARSDYLSYVDGKPRCDGVESFLRSRGISLPRGSPDDAPGKETVCGIGNRKNELYLKMLEQWGVSPYPETVDFVHQLKSKGIRLALISASKNAKRVLRLSGLSNLFDVVVDGVDSLSMGLRGKPAPDIFLEAARRLGVVPERAALVEDAQAGVEAGKNGGFAVVIGVDRAGQGEDLKQHGADLAVRDLSDIRTVGREDWVSEMLPSALINMDVIFRGFHEGTPALFLDYDGTLTPIVSTPSMAVLSDAIRDYLRELAKHCLVTIVSGRDLDDVRKMVGLDSLAYVGSHGFEVMGAGGTFRDESRGRPFLPSLDGAEAELKSRIERIAGAFVERKRFAIALHYRMADQRDVPELERTIASVAEKYPDLRKAGGKKVFELLPNTEWDKGKMVLFLLDKFHVNEAKTVPIYIGDDVTDEDAFRALVDRGVTILVSDHPQDTSAHFGLRNVAEVAIFLEELEDQFEKEFTGGIWSLRYDGFKQDKELLRESLCSIGNGYFASRGTAPESEAGDHHYPGTYLAGTYNRLISDVAGRTIENESIVNIPNWLCLSLRIEDGNWFDPGTENIQEYFQELDMFRGVLSRTVVWTDDKGRRTRIDQRRFVSVDCPNIAGIQMTVTPENWSGSLRVLTALDGKVDNTLVERYRQLNNHHLDQRGAGVSDEEIIWLRAETNQSLIYITEAARTRVLEEGHAIPVERRTVKGEGYIGQEMEIPVKKGFPVQVDKVAAVYSSKDRAISEGLIEALDLLRNVGDFDELCSNHEKGWAHMWRKYQIYVEGDHKRISQVLNLHILHLLQTVSSHTIDLDVGVPPRGLNGEAYRGLIMWDEIFIFPFLNFRIPDLTRSLLLYRYRRLTRARWAARAAGFGGAMFPWQSGSDGREEGQTTHLNPMSGRWIPDNTQLERHISLAIAYNVWQYYQITGDRDFLSFYGAEMLIEISRFWASKVRFNEKKGRYEILRVMGPDEFHDMYPGAAEPGIDNNSYTNVMVTWLLSRALDALRLMSEERRRAIWEDLDLKAEELDRWSDIGRKMFVPFHEDGVISQFEGYEALRELDWDGYRKKYRNIDRLDRILEAEGDSANRYKVSKQADVLMLFYLFSQSELKETFDQLGYRLDLDVIPKTIDYYMKRTSHGSTLSRVVHAWVLSRYNRKESWNLFREALRSDVADIQNGTTHEGIHLGAMAGTVDIVQRCYSGLEARGDRLRLDPSLPVGLKRLQFEITYRGRLINIEISQNKLFLTSRPQIGAPIPIEFKGGIHMFAPGDTLEFDLS